MLFSIKFSVNRILRNLKDIFLIKIQETRYLSNNSETVCRDINIVIGAVYCIILNFKE